MNKKSSLLIAALGGFVLVAQLAAQGPPAGGRGGSGAGGRGAGRGAGGGGGAARGGFTQFTRELAAPDVIARGKAVFYTNCSSCHATDLSGVPPQGHSILHSIIALDDKHGELINAELLKHAAPITLS